jgi:hypothetical protein
LIYGHFLHVKCFTKIPLRFCPFPAHSDRPSGRHVPKASFCIGSEGWPQADQRQMRDRAQSAHLPRRISPAAVHPACRWLLRMEGDQGTYGQTAPCHRHEERQPIRHWRALGELEGPYIGLLGEGGRGPGRGKVALADDRQGASAARGRSGRSKPRSLDVISEGIEPRGDLVHHQKINGQNYNSATRTLPFA